VVLLLPEDGVLTVKGRLSAGRISSTRLILLPPTGPGTTTARPGAARTRCRVPSGCSCRCEPGWGDRRHRDRRRPHRAVADADQRRLLDALVDQGALAIERVLLVEDMDRVKARWNPTGCAARS